MSSLGVFVDETLGQLSPLVTFFGPAHGGILYERSYFRIPESIQLQQVLDDSKKRVLPRGWETFHCRGFMARPDGRETNALREITIEPGVAPNAQGSVLISFGQTRVICAAMIEESVPRWMKEQGVSGGWVTAEYSMLPYSTLTRKPREISRGRADGRGTEIQRLIGRSLRAAVDLKAMGSRTLWVDCDVVQADGGTRTAAITGACVAVELAFRRLITLGKLARSPMKRKVAAVSVGMVGGEAVLDLNYLEDKDASVDLNLVMTGELDFVEVQGSGEEAVFSQTELTTMLDLGRSGVQELLAIQDSILKI